MVEGWNKIYRSIQDHWLWTCEPFSRGQAWIDLLLMANHKANKVMINGTLEVVERGQRVTSIRKLADRWGWSTKKVSHFLDQLVKDKMIEYISDNSKTIITIVNYDKYQGKETPLSIDSAGFYEDIGNAEETQKKHQGNMEETQKKNEGNSKEKQKKTNKNDKEYIKNDKEGEEGEEGKEEAPVLPSLPSLSFPTEVHKKIYEELSDVSYRTFFIDTKITETDNKITIKVNNDFHKGVIRDRFKDKLHYIFFKEIDVI